MNRYVLADKDIPYLDDFIPESVKLVRFDPLKDWSAIPKETRDSCKAILIRTVSKIDAQHFDVKLFPVLQFVGTASAGFDHVDVDFLTSYGIHFSDAGGANAQAVGEYVASAIVQWSIDTGKTLHGLSVGVVGYGHTGSSAGTILGKLGCNIIAHDPPKSLKDPTFNSNSIEEVLQCDVITFHVPLITKSDYPTNYWMDEDKLSRFSGHLLINAARGGVVKESSLVDWVKKGSNKRFVLDVWENEPRLDRKVAELAWISTPHIAGYSIQAKRNATRMVLKSMCEYLDIPNTIGESCTSFLNLNVYQSWHPLFELSETLKQGLTEDLNQNATHFRNLRQHSKLRNEFRFVTAGKFERLADNPLVQKLINVCGGPL